MTAPRTICNYDIGLSSREVVAYTDALASAEPSLRVMAHALGYVTSHVPAFLATYGIAEAGVIARPVVRTHGPSAPDPMRLYERYVTDYAALDPFLRRTRANAGGVVTIDDIGGKESFAASRFAREYLASIEAEARLCLLFEYGGRPHGMIALTRHRQEGDFTANEIRFLEDCHAFLQSVHRIAGAR